MAGDRSPPGAPPFGLDAVSRDLACTAVRVCPVAHDPLNNPLPALVVTDPGRFRVLTPSGEEHLYVPTAPRIVDAQCFHSTKAAERQFD